VRRHRQGAQRLWTAAKVAPTAAIRSSALAITCNAGTANPNGPKMAAAAAAGATRKDMIGAAMRLAGNE
jgi:hypothetical protein